MTNSENRNDEALLGDLLRPLLLYRRLIWQGTLAATVIAMLLGSAYYFTQPSTWTGSLVFRPMFLGSETGLYPNGLSFSANDIIAPSIVELVFAKNGLDRHCDLDTFRAGLSVQESSAAVQLINAEYQARLSDARLTAVERQRLQDEYNARRFSMPRDYRLIFLRPPACAGVPRDVLLKVMTELPEAWAQESEERRGVLKGRAAVLSAEIFNLPDVANTSLLVRADLIRGAIGRVINSVVEAEKLPGAELVRGGEPPMTFAEVRSRLEDLQQARLDPLIAIAGRGLGRDSAQWVNQALETAQARQRASEMVADAYRQALREYSGQPATAAPAAGGKPAGGAPASSDVQTLAPQIDRTFIEGIVALSAANTSFRQEITRKLIEASTEAARRSQVVDHYRALLASMNNSANASLPMEEVSRRLDTLTTEAKAATRQFNEVYADYSRVAFRAGSAMYRVEQPLYVNSQRNVTTRQLGLVVVGVFVVTPIVLAMACLVLFHFRRYVRSALPA